MLWAGILCPSLSSFMWELHGLTGRIWAAEAAHAPPALGDRRGSSGPRGLTPRQTVLALWTCSPPPGQHGAPGGNSAEQKAINLCSPQGLAEGLYLERAHIKGGLQLRQGQPGPAWREERSSGLEAANLGPLGHSGGTFWSIFNINFKKF